MTGDSGGSERRRYSYVVAPSMHDVLRQPLPPESVFQWLEEGLRNPKDERIFLLCCMYFLQLRAIRRMSSDSVVQATTTKWTKTTSRVSSDTTTRNSRVSYEETKIITTQTQMPASADKGQLPEGQRFWERLAEGDCEARHQELNMVRVQCEASYDYDKVGKEDGDDSEIDQTMSGKKSDGKMARLRRSLVKLFKKDSDKLSRTFSNKNVDDLLSVKNGKLRDSTVGKHTIAVRRQYSNLLNVEPRLSFNYLGYLDERQRSRESDVLYKNDKFNNYNVSDLNVVRSRTVVSVIQQQQQQEKQLKKETTSSPAGVSAAAAAHAEEDDDDDMDSDVREALAAFEDAYLSDPGPMLTTELHDVRSRDVWKTLATSSKVGPFPRFRDTPSPPSLDWHPPNFHTTLAK